LDRQPGAVLKKGVVEVLDAFKGHLTEKVKAVLPNPNRDPVTLPGGMTSHLLHIL
jgi:hypothetical protein